MQSQRTKQVQAVFRLLGRRLHEAMMKMCIDAGAPLVVTMIEPRTSSRAG